MAETKPLVGVVMGSASDLEQVQGCLDALKELGVPYEVTVASAHRTPDRASEYAKTAAKRGLKVIIAAAGWAAHLPGVLAAYTTLPIIGLPLGGSPLGGKDALYAMVQMPPGIPVATVGINTGRNAGILAAQILAVSDEALSERLVGMRQKMAAKVIAAAEKLGAGE
jgi:phosphoribosylaminoimidazole carboxylase PurE protein